MYSKAAVEISTAKESKVAKEAIGSLFVKLRERRPSSAEFEVGFRELSYSTDISRTNRLVRYSLTEIARAKGQSFVGDMDDLTIEHLAPQSTDEIPLEFVNMIGNLLLVPQDLNEKLSNKTFKEKQRILASAGMTVPSDVLTSEQWGQAEIEQRTNMMATLAYETVWSY